MDFNKRVIVCNFNKSKRTLINQKIKSPQKRRYIFSLFIKEI